MASKFNKFLLILVVILSAATISTAQGITTFEEYKNHVPSAVIFWEEPPRLVSIGNCNPPFIPRNFIKQYIKNCKNTSRTEGSCQRSCGSYESFDIRCMKYSHIEKGYNMYQWFPHKAIPLCTGEEIKQEKYRAKSDSVIYWDQRDRPVEPRHSFWCGRPVLERTVTGGFINNCSYDYTKQYEATCTLGCWDETFKIFCHRDEDNKIKWFPTENILRICGTTSESTSPSTISRYDRDSKPITTTSSVVPTRLNNVTSLMDINSTPSTTPLLDSNILLISTAILGTLLFIVCITFIGYIIKKRTKKNRVILTAVPNEVNTEVVYDEIDLSKAVPIPDPELPPRVREVPGYLGVLEPYQYDEVRAEQPLQQKIKLTRFFRRSTQNTVGEDGYEIPMSRRNALEKKSDAGRFL